MATQQEKACENKSRQDEEEQIRQQQSHGRTDITPHEAQQYRAGAQQKSIDLIRAAEELFAKVRQSRSAAPNESKDAAVQGLGATTTDLAGKGSQAAGYTAERGEQGYEAAKDTAFTAGEKEAELARQAAANTKDTSLPEETKEAAKEKSEKEKELTSETAESGKGKTEDAGREAAEATREKTGEAKKKQLGDQTEESREKMSILSISEEEKESKEPRKRHETGEVDDKGEWIVVKELEPEVEIAEDKSKIREAIGIFEAVGESAIEAAMTDKEFLGKGPEKGEQR